MPELTEQELRVANALGNIWNEFLLFPVLHPSDRREFEQAIHVAQNIILSRPFARKHLAAKEEQ